MNIKWVGSPNYDTKRTTIDEVFIHWIVGTLSSADAQFQKSNGTSAHYGVEDDQVHQYVKEEHVAYHAGVYSHNQRSIGIEHSAAPDRLASDKTYETSGRLIAEICQRYNIPLDRTHIRAHKEVRATQCPGTMDIDRLINLAKGFTKEIKPTVAVEQDVFETLVSKSTEYDKFTSAGYYHLEDVSKILTEKERSIQNLTSDVNKCELRVGELLDAAQKINEEDKNTSQELMDAQHALKPLQDELEAIRKELGIFPEASIVNAIKMLKESKIKQATKPITFIEKLRFLFG